MNDSHTITASGRTSNLLPANCWEFNPMIFGENVQREPNQSVQRAPTNIAAVEVGTLRGFPASHNFGDLAGEIAAPCAALDDDIIGAVCTDRRASLGLGLVDESKSLQKPIFGRLQEMHGVHGLYRSAWNPWTLAWLGAYSRVIAGPLAYLTLELIVELRPRENPIKGSVSEHLLPKCPIISALYSEPCGGIYKYPLPGGHNIKHSQLHVWNSLLQ
jgi:hypothetical protein